MIKKNNLMKDKNPKIKITEASGYQAYPYVKYITKNGEYQIRMD